MITLYLTHLASFDSTTNILREGLHKIEEKKEYRVKDYEHTGIPKDHDLAAAITALD